MKTREQFPEKAKAIEAMKDDDSTESAKALMSVILGLSANRPEMDKERDLLSSLINEIQVTQMSTQARVFRGKEKKKDFDEKSARLTLLGKQRDEQEQLARAAMHVLASYKSPSTEKAIGARVNSGDATLRGALLQALGMRQSALLSQKLKKLLKDSHPELRIHASLATQHFGSEDHSDQLIKIACQDKCWAVRASALKTLSALKITSAVPTLIPRLTKEDGRLITDVAQTLEALTGESLGENPGAWNSWLADQGDTLESKPKQRRSRLSDPREPLRYHGVHSHSRQMVFVLDTSRSMDESWAVDGTGINKLVAAKQELKRVLSRLTPKDKFGLVVYNNIVVKWKTKMVPATKTNIAQAAEYVDNLVPVGKTNVYEAMEAAFFINGFSAGHYYQEGVDTIFFLSDGSPSWGRIDNLEEIHDQIGIWNTARQIVIHAIGLGEDHDARFMRRLARDSGGQYVSASH